MIEFTGNCPESVRRDARYRIRLDKGAYVVGISYTTGDGEIWTPTTTEHPELVEMVNRVKRAINDQPGGGFYINEFRQVIVPAGREGKYYLAGEYEAPLSFKIKDDSGRDVVISGRAEDWNGRPLNPGDEWTGCMMGIPYVLTAKGGDIRFEIKLSENHFLRIPLSRVTDPVRARALARRLAQIIGNENGGRFYINDMREMFKPVGTTLVSYIYLGELRSDDPWFPKDLFLKRADQARA